MTMETEQLVVLLEAKIKDFEKSFQRAERQGTKTYTSLERGSRKATAQMEADMARSSARVNQAISGMSMKAGTFGKAFLAGLAGGAIAAVLGGITSDIRGTIGAVADLADEAARIGIDPEELQGLQFGMKLAGVDAADASAALEKFTDNVGEAAAGGGALLNILKANGVALRDIDGSIRPTNELLGEFADIVEKTPDAAAKMNLVTDAFGRGGKQMVLAMAGGSKGLADMVSEARTAGAVLDNDLVKRAAVLDDKFDALTIRASTFFKTIILGSADGAGALTSMLDSVLAPDQIEAFLGGLDPAQILGDDVLAALEADSAALKKASQDIAELGGSLRITQNHAADFWEELWQTVDALNAVGQTDAADKVIKLADQLGEANRAFNSGEISGEEYQGRLSEVSNQAVQTVADLSLIDGVDFSAVRGAVFGFAGAMATLRDRAAEAYTNVKKISGLSLSVTATAEAGTTLGASGAGAVTLDVNAPAVESGAGGGGGGGGGARQIDALITDLQTEGEILSEWYAESLDLLNGATAAQLEALGGRHDALERLEREHQERMGEIQTSGGDDAVSSASTLFGALATITKEGGDRLQRISRAAAAAEALINTYRAQSQVLADPTLGFWAKLPAVAAIGAAGLALVSSLGGGGGSASPSSSGGSSGLSSGADAPPAPARLDVTIQGLKPDQIYSGQQIIDLTDALIDEFGNRGLNIGWQS